MSCRSGCSEVAEGLSEGLTCKARKGFINRRRQKAGFSKTQPGAVLYYITTHPRNPSLQHFNCPAL